MSRQHLRQRRHRHRRTRRRPRSCPAPSHTSGTNSSRRSRCMASQMRIAMASKRSCATRPCVCNQLSLGAIAARKRRPQHLAPFITSVGHMQLLPSLSATTCSDLSWTHPSSCTTQSPMPQTMQGHPVLRQPPPRRDHSTRDSYSCRCAPPRPPLSRRPVRPTSTPLPPPPQVTSPRQVAAAAAVGRPSPPSVAAILTRRKRPLRRAYSPPICAPCSGWFRPTTLPHTSRACSSSDTPPATSVTLRRPRPRRRRCKCTRGAGHRPRTHRATHPRVRQCR